MEMSCLLTRCLTGTTLTTRLFLSRASTSANETQEITRAACVWEGEHPLSRLCLSDPPQGTLYVKKQTPSGEKEFERAREEAALKAFLSTAAGNGKSKFVAGRARVVELLAAPSPHQHQGQV